MDFQALKATYFGRHWQNLDDSARQHLHQFVAFVEGEFAAWSAPAEAKATEVVAEAKTEEAAVASELGAAPAPTTGEPDPVVVVTTETKVYADGTTATGPGPLPEQSPAEQDAVSGQTATDSKPAESSETPSTPATTEPAQPAATAAEQAPAA